MTESLAKMPVTSKDWAGEWNCREMDKWGKWTCRRYFPPPLLCTSPQRISKGILLRKLSADGLHDSKPFLLPIGTFSHHVTCIELALIFVKLLQFSFLPIFSCFSHIFCILAVNQKGFFCNTTSDST